MARGKAQGADNKIRPSELEGTPLGEHDGLPVTQCAAVVTKTGDGLSEAMGMAKFHVPVLSEGVLIVPVKVLRHSYQRASVSVKGEGKVLLDEFVETTYYEAQGAFLADPDLVAELTARHMERVQEHRAEAAEAQRAARGEIPLPGTAVKESAA